MKINNRIKANIMNKIRSNARQIIEEQYRAYHIDSKVSMREQVEVEAENSDGFFQWLFDEDDEVRLCDLNEEQKNAYDELLNSLPDTYSASIKHFIVDEIDFTKEEYDEKVLEKDYATFDEFIDTIVENAIENNGGVDDVVFIANDAYNKL